MKPWQKINTGFVIAVMIGVITFSTACNLPMKNPNQAKSTFELVMLNHEVAEQGKWENREDSWKVLQAAYPDEVSCRIGIDAIESYEWDLQVITMTAAASQSIKNGEQACFEPDKTERYAWYHPTPFVVVLDNLPIYGGLVIPSDIITARVLDYPIILLDWVEDKMVLHVQPGYSMFYQFKEDEWQPIKDERIRELFLELGKLK